MTKSLNAASQLRTNADSLTLHSRLMNVDQALQAVIAAGGGAVGKIATTEVKSVGVLRVVYARDPEGNIIELQKWG
jgi:predicted enzyme related to lactoylglutathione lyase